MAREAGPVDIYDHLDSRKAWEQIWISITRVVHASSTTVKLAVYGDYY